MKISFIIPNYNNQYTIGRTIKSIQDSKIKDSEIIVIDEASTDNSVNKIKKFKQVKLIIQKNNLGAASARNKGIQEAKGTILVFIDSDAWFKKNSIKTLIKNIITTDIVFPKTIFENSKIFYPIFNIEKNYPHISVCFAIFKSSLGKIRFDEKFGTYNEDTDFFMRCSLAELKAKYIDDSIVIHKDKGNCDYKKRYYLEVRNTVYGIKKWMFKPKTNEIYNPFKLSTLFKLFIYGLINFAWFNWSGYDRKNKKMYKNIKNKITKNTIKLPFLFIKGIIDGLRTTDFH